MSRKLISYSSSRYEPPTTYLLAKANTNWFTAKNGAHVGSQSSHIKIADKERKKERTRRERHWLRYEQRSKNKVEWWSVEGKAKKEKKNIEEERES